MSKKISRQANKLLGEIGKLEFRGLRLIESSSKLGELKKDELPAQATQFINVVMIVSDDSKTVAVNARIKLAATYDGDETKEPAMSVFASFLVNYVIVEKFSTKELLEKIVERIAMLNIWPYWREFVQSMTTRMGLPPFPVPLVYMDKLLKNKPIANVKN